MLNLRQIEIFRTLMNCRSTVVSARELGMSQPAVSNALKTMEKSLGFPLFSRISRRLVPTEEGQALLDEAERIFQVKLAFDQAAASLRSGHRGTIRIAATAELSAALLPRALAAFGRSYPEVRVSVETLPLSATIDQVTAGAADLGFAMGVEGRDNLALVRLTQMELVCVFPADSALAQRPRITPADLRGHALIATSGAAGRMMAEAFREAAEPWEPRIEVRFMNIAARMARAGLGVTLTDPLTAAGLGGSGLMALPFVPVIGFGLEAILPAERAPKMLARAFVASTRQAVARILPGS